MERKKRQILTDLEVETPEAVARRYRIRLEYFQTRGNFWIFNDEEPRSERSGLRITSLPLPPAPPVPPKLEVGKWYRFWRHDTPLEYIGVSPGNTPDGLHYLFRGRSRSKESFTVIQLLDDFLGEEGQKCRKLHRRK